MALELLSLIDYIIGYTCISKTKVNMIKEIENSGYTRKQLYECIDNNKDEIKTYLEQKNISQEYGKLAYIFTVVKTKIKDDSIRTFGVDFMIDIPEDVDIIVDDNSDSVRDRIKKSKENLSKGNTINQILERYYRDKGEDI